ncbi:MAG: NAD(P)-dependent oxidoreductase [Acidobacteriota bacterium]|nr:NAD(P)-dependent oxidoreductase [Acidobacteriota bacterium]
MITILGAEGFIGSHLARHLRESNVAFETPHRDEPLRGRPLGHVIDCAGVTADFRTRPYDTVDAHVCRIVDFARHCSFDSFVYLSSTRLYKDQQSDKAREHDDLTVEPTTTGGLYNLSKAMGEAVVLTLGDRGRVVRLSNVYGDGSEPHNFLASIVTDALTTGEIVLRTSLESAKDYVSVSDVVTLLPRIATEARERIYNVAGGVNVTNGEITAAIARITGCKVSVAPNAETWLYPEISIERAHDEFGFTPAALLDHLPALIDAYKREVAR